MKKLKLDLDQVQVTSFSAETVERGGGTVNGFSDRDTWLSYECCSWPRGCPEMFHTQQEQCTIVGC